MPLLDTIKGVKICVYSNDHVPPHIHAIYNEYEILINLRTMEIIRGEMPPNKRKIGIDYAKVNQAALLDLFHELNPSIKKM